MACSRKSKSKVSKTTKAQRAKKAAAYRRKVRRQGGVVTLL